MNGPDDEYEVFWQEWSDINDLIDGKPPIRSGGAMPSPDGPIVTFMGFEFVKQPEE